MQLVGSGVISPESVKTQARQCLANIGPVLRVVRSNVSKIVSCICFVTDMSFALIARAAWDHWIKSDDVVSSTASPGETTTVRSFLRHLAWLSLSPSLHCTPFRWRGIRRDQTNSASEQWRPWAQWSCDQFHSGGGVAPRRARRVPGHRCSWGRLPFAAYHSIRRRPTAAQATGFLRKGIRVDESEN